MNIESTLEPRDNYNYSSISPTDSPLKQSDLEHLPPHLSMEETKRAGVGKKGGDMAQTEKITVNAAVLPQMVHFGTQKTFEDTDSQKWRLKVGSDGYI